MAVLGPDETRSRLDLVSVHPGYTFAEVQERTGFPLDPAGARPTQVPTDEELAILRSFPDGRKLKGLAVAP
jgi:hypothetical protein